MASLTSSLLFCELVEDARNVDVKFVELLSVREASVTSILALEHATK